MSNDKNWQTINQPDGTTRELNPIFTLLENGDCRVDDIPTGHLRALGFGLRAVMERCQVVAARDGSGGQLREFTIGSMTAQRMAERGKRWDDDGALEIVAAEVEAELRENIAPPLPDSGDVN